MEKEIISIAEYAKRCQVSKIAIYKQIENKTIDTDVIKIEIKGIDINKFPPVIGRRKRRTK